MEENILTFEKSFGMKKIKGIVQCIVSSELIIIYFMDESSN